jgi:hypothetical protein
MELQGFAVARRALGLKGALAATSNRRRVEGRRDERYRCVGSVVQPQATALPAGETAPLGVEREKPEGTIATQLPTPEVDRDSGSRVEVGECREQQPPADPILLSHRRPIIAGGVAVE